MKLLFDQNVSPKLVDSLKNLFPDSVHVQDVGLDRAIDIDIWNYAKQNNFIILSKDADFVEQSLLTGYPPFVIWLRSGNCTTTDITKILTENYLIIKELIEKGKTGFLSFY